MQYALYYVAIDIVANFPQITLLPEPYHCFVYLEYSLKINSSVDSQLAYATCMNGSSDELIALSINRTDYGHFAYLPVSKYQDTRLIFTFNPFLQPESTFSISLILYGFGGMVFEKDTLFLMMPFEFSTGTASPMQLQSSPLAEISKNSNSSVILHWALEINRCGSRTTYFLIHVYANYDEARLLNTTIVFLRMILWYRIQTFA